VEGVDLTQRIQLMSEEIWRRWARGFLAAFLVLIVWQAPASWGDWNVQWSDLAAAGFLLSALAAGVWRWGRPPLVTWVVLYLGASLPSLVHSAHPGASVLEFVKTMYLACFALVLATWIRTCRAWEEMTKWFSFAVAATILIALCVWAYGAWSGHAPAGLAVAMAVPNVGQVIRAKAFLPTPTMLANYLTMGIPMLVGYAAARSHWPRAASWTILAAGLLAAGTTASHSIAGCLVAAALIAPRTTRWDRFGRWGFSLLAVFAVLFSLAATTVAVHDIQTARAPAASQPASLADHEFPGPRGTGEELTVQVRYTWVVYALFKQFAWEAWQSHPWIGIGLAEFPYVVTRAFESGRIHPYYAGGADPHSTWFGTLAETGLVGLAGLMGLWIALLRAAARTKERVGQSVEWWGVRAAFAGLMGLLINSVHVDVMHFRFLWVGAALLLAAAQRPADRTKPAMAGAHS